MEQGSRPNPSTDATALSLGDLFVPRATAPGQAAVQVSSLDIPPALASRWTAQAEASGFLPDTLFAAAWILLQSRWLGTSTVELHEGLDESAGTHIAVNCDDSTTAQQWLAALDSARRGAAIASTTAEAPSPFALWLRDGASAGQADAPSLQLDFHAPAGRPATLRLAAAAALMDSAIELSLLLAIADTAADLLDRPAASLREIRTLPAIDRQRQLQTWNSAASAYDAALTVHAMFDRQVAARPDAIALVGVEGALSYRELAERAEQMARRLQARGIRAGDTVGVMLDRSSAAVVVMLGILKAGAVYVPVQSDFPAERIAFMFSHANVGLVVTQAAYRQLVPSERPLLSIDDLAGQDAALPALAPAAADGESVAYVMYTSGSTGTPKGVEICHRSILRLVGDAHYVELACGRRRAARGAAGLRCLDARNLGPAAQRRRLRRARREGADRRRPRAHHRAAFGDDRLAHRRRCSMPWSTTTRRSCAGLRQLLTGGEALSVPHVRRALAALPDITLINGYGPTECTTFAATLPHPARPAGRRALGADRPPDRRHRAARARARSMPMLPVGLVGELYIGGAAWRAATCSAPT